MTLIKVKERKIDNQKHEKKTHENEGAQNWELEKLTKIEVQTQPKVREYQ